MLKRVSNAGARRGIAQSGSASGLGPEGRRFESCCPDQLETPGTNRGTPPGQRTGRPASGSGPAQIVGGWEQFRGGLRRGLRLLTSTRSRSCRLNHSKLSRSFSITPTASPRRLHAHSRSTTVSQASQAMINRWRLETSAAGTSGGRKANQRIAPNGRAAFGKVGQSRLQF